MSDVIFVRTRTHYGSYQDYWRLVELNEYPIIYVDEIPRDGAKDKTFIITPANGEWENGIQTDGRAILWDFEWRIEDGSYPRIPGCAEYWHMDAAQARQHGARYVPLGGDARLKLDTPKRDIGVEYDVAYLGYMTNRRQRILHELVSAGLSLPPTSMWDEDRHQTLLHSKVYLHVHQLDNAPGVPALRLVVAAAYGLPVVSEEFADPGVFAAHVWQIPYEHIAHLLTGWQFGEVSQENSLSAFLNAEYTFRRGIEAHV